MKKDTKLNIVGWISDVLFILGIACIVVAIWSNGWIILRLICSGIFSLIFSFILVQVKKELKGAV